MREHDSPEEMYLEWYLQELKDNGLVKHFTNEIKPIKLNKAFEVTVTIPMKRVPDKKKVKTYIEEHNYTPDYFVIWEPAALQHKGITDYFVIASNDAGHLYSYIEVKPMYDKNNMTRIFKQRTQPWIWDKYNWFVQLVKVPMIFKHTFTPGRYLLTNKSHKPRKINFMTRSFNEWSS